MCLACLGLVSGDFRSVCAGAALMFASAQAQGTDAPR